jgi:hypothetical protein
MPLGYEFSGLTGEWQLIGNAPVYRPGDKVELLIDVPNFPAGTVGTVIRIFDPPYPEAYDYDAFVEVIFGEPDEEGLVWCYSFLVVDKDRRTPGTYIESDLKYVGSD